MSYCIYLFTRFVFASVSITLRYKCHDLKYRSVQVQSCQLVITKGVKSVKMHAFLDVVYFVVSSVLVCCAAQTDERRWPHEVFSPPYHLLSIRAERYILPLLPYELGDLEPYIDRETVVAHYEGHHEAYRRKMNVALNEWREDVSLTGLADSLWTTSKSLLI